MFTLCMSRRDPSLPESHKQNYMANKQVKGGYLLRYRRGIFCKGWSEEWVVLYEDSTIAFYADKGLSRPRGRVRIGEAPDLLAVGEWTHKVPQSPRIPRSCTIEQLLVIGCRSPKAVHWLMAKSSVEVNDWMTAISNTLPSPPRLPVDNKQRATNFPKELSSQGIHSSGGGEITNKACKCDKYNNRYEDDYTVLSDSGVVIDWGHGWGWGQAACQSAAQVSMTESIANAAMHCHTVHDYNVSGYEEVDWSAFGDFCF